MSEVINETNPTVVEPESKPEVKTVTMTQAEFDAVIVREKGRVKSKFADYDDLKAKLEAYEKAKEESDRAELTEIERYKSDLEKIVGERDAFKNEITDWQSKFQKQAITNEFYKVATSLNVQYVDDAIKLADLSAVTVGEDGKVEGIEEIVKTLVENKPFLVAQKQPQKLGEPTSGNKDTSDKTSEQILEDARLKAMRSGRAEDRVAYATLKQQLGK
jgi:hypothetical protein